MTSDLTIDHIHYTVSRDDHFIYLDARHKDRRVLVNLFDIDQNARHSRWSSEAVLSFANERHVKYVDMLVTNYVKQATKDQLIANTLKQRIDSPALMAHYQANHPEEIEDIVSYVNHIYDSSYFTSDSKFSFLKTIHDGLSIDIDDDFHDVVCAAIDTSRLFVRNELENQTCQLRIINMMMQDLDLKSIRYRFRNVPPKRNALETKLTFLDDPSSLTDVPDNTGFTR